ncbi:DUF2183 domain-containing protein [Altererythrobacter aurantiacus]|uniref:DUF2183 domain-containing protein n=1 Tax=Parapontixanthobacter aurantiacus TaxID=1463599 RepID=A0A844ZMN9_9SPHN|nr:phosphatase domain-containing protein [Parapontixanthobacter aurantiacus]MXO86919.1 DUF2183 domain-containing protein [Parapontixanthobacter aurantiacus]
MQFLFSHPVRIQPYFGYRNRERLRISVRALRQKRREFNASGKWQAMRTMLSQFASKEAMEVSVALEIEHGGETTLHDGVTDKEGFVHFDVALEPAAELPERTSWESVVIRWSNSDGEQEATGQVLVPGRHAGLGVISDIDDTIIETGITGNWRDVARNWRRVLAQMPDERLLVPGADIFYQAMGGGEVLPAGSAHAGERHRATANPFFYVSSSPWNLFSYLVAFQKGRGLPLGPIALRDWGFNRETLGKASHGAHKLAAMDTILGTYPEMQFALMGDDTQGDLVAFGKMVESHPGRIRAVLIRQAGEAMSSEELAAKATIEAARVPLWLGSDYSTGAAFLEEIGLRGESAAEELAKTIETKGKAPPGDPAPPTGKASSS